jgi:hypothetical protein
MDPGGADANLTKKELWLGELLNYQVVPVVDVMPPPQTISLVRYPWGRWTTQNRSLCVALKESDLQKSRAVHIQLHLTVRNIDLCMFGFCNSGSCNRMFLCPEFLKMFNP